MAGRDLDAVLAAIGELTMQVARLAYATETALHSGRPAMHGRKTCPRCGCSVIAADAAVCPVCRRDEFEQEEKDGGQAPQ